MRIKNVQGASGVGDHILPNVKNVDTVVIPRGTPVVLTLNGTADGYGVVLPSTAGQAKSNAFAWGVCQTIGGLGIGATDDVYGTGYCPFAIVVYATRSASSASWTSSASIASGAIMSIDTVNNAYTTASASIGSLGQGQLAVLLDTIASFAASASATSDTRTALTVGARVFLRYI
jgi:hypothetical protein